MSELPISPAFTQESTQESAPQYQYTSSEFARDINVLDNDPASRAGFDLERDDPLNPDLWKSEAEVVAAPVYTQLTHKDRLAMAYEQMTPRETVTDIMAVSGGVVSLRDYYQRAANR